MVEHENIEFLKQLATETGYQFKAENGQLVYGPPLDMVDFVPPKYSECFIGKLPKDIDGRVIVRKFEEFGRIITFRIMQNFSGLNRGFAFIQYETIQQADDAIRMLDNYEIRPGCRIGVIRSRNNTRLYVGKLDTSLSKEQITAYFKNSTTGLTHLTLHKDPNQDDTGYAFLEYETHKDAARARRSLKPCKLKLGSKHFTVDWATTNGPENSSNNTSSSSDGSSVVKTNSFTNRFSSMVFNHLSSGTVSDDLTDTLGTSINSNQRSDGELILLLTNLRPGVEVEQISNIFSMNTCIKMRNIKRGRNSILFHYTSACSAIAVLRSFQVIKEEFDKCFGGPGGCELIFKENSYLNENRSNLSNIWSDNYSTASSLSNF